MVEVTTTTTGTAAAAVGGAAADEVRTTRRSCRGMVVRRCRIGIGIVRSSGAIVTAATDRVGRRRRRGFVLQL